MRQANLRGTGSYIQIVFQRALDLGFSTGPPVDPPKHQLLKWIGNKQRHVRLIATHFPASFGTYFEPFLGSGAMLASLAPDRACGSDVLMPLVGIFRALQSSPETVKEWYAERWALIAAMGKHDAYHHVRSSYNEDPNAADLLFISRTGYGGVIRFRLDGYISTPCGAHRPIHPISFNRRVDEWARRVADTVFECMDYREAMSHARKEDLVYCDPPYTDSQSILYGAQRFSVEDLWLAAERCKMHGATVAVSLDNTKRSGSHTVMAEVPDGLFSREIVIDSGRSMMRRFQMAGQELDGEHVTERLLIT